MAWTILPKKELKLLIERYAQKLASSEKVDYEGTVTCHLAKVMLFDEDRYNELRVRSIQMVSEISERDALPPAIKELVNVSRKWPEPKETELARLLAIVLKKCGASLV